jgi:hypothetical protein
MPTRRDLTGVAHGLLGSFMSRSNDNDGYWALGKLYAFAISADVSEIEIDIVRSATLPTSSDFDDVIRRFRGLLNGRLAAGKLYG